MASGLTLRIAQMTAKADFKGTDQQFKSALEDFLEMRQLDTTGTDQEKLQRVVDYIWKENMDSIRRYRKDKLMAQQLDSLRNQIDTELPV